MLIYIVWVLHILYKAAAYSILSCPSILDSAQTPKINHSTSTYSCFSFLIIPLDSDQNLYVPIHNSHQLSCSPHMFSWKTNPKILQLFWGGKTIASNEKTRLFVNNCLERSYVIRSLWKHMVSIFWQTNYVNLSLS